MRITYVYPKNDFTLVLEFDKQEYRKLNMKVFLESSQGLLAEVRDCLDIFLTVNVDGIAGTVYWGNGVDFDPTVLYKNSIAIDD